MHLENEIGEEANPCHKTMKVLFLVLCHFLTVVCKILLMSDDHCCILGNDYHFPPLVTCSLEHT